MKRPLLFVLLNTAILLCAINALSQKIYKSGSHGQAYSKAMPPSLPVAQDVYQSFQRNTEVTVIDFSGTELKSPSQVYSKSIAPVIKQGDFFAVTNKSAMETIVEQYPDVLTMVMPFNKRKITLDLVKSDILSDDFAVVTDENGTTAKVNTGAYYKGIIRGEKSLVSISFFPTHVEGLISPSGKPAIELGKMKNSSSDNVHVIYSDDNLLLKQKFVCRTPSPTPEYLQQMKNMPRMSLDELSKAPLRCVTGYWETRYNIFQKFKTTEAVTDFVTALFNSFAVVYANEKIGMKLRRTRIWLKNDPYDDDLDSFSSGRTGFDADLALLLSTSGGGGVAWLSSVCRTDDHYRHAFCGSVSNEGSELPSFSWPVEVTTHETGHNLGSPHTHDCSWNGNNTAIDGCGPKAGYNAGCDGPLPIKGTIMSYCHLVGSVGIDLALGFGDQPGDLIRGRVASCITLHCRVGDSTCNPPADIAAINIKEKTARITWSGVPKHAYYYVYLRRNDTTSWTLAGDKITTRYFVVTGLTPGKKYHSKVGVACNNGQSLLSPAVTFTTAESAKMEIAAATNSQINSVSQSVQVLPNPARGGKFTVMLPKGMENATLQIVNNLGQTIASDKNNGLQRSFNITNSKGLYFVKVFDGNKLQALKVIVP